MSERVCSGASADPSPGQHEPFLVSRPIPGSPGLLHRPWRVGGLQTELARYSFG